MSWLTLLLPSLAPAVVDGFSQLIRKFTGTNSADPKNVAETIQLIAAQTERVKALADIDRLPDGASLWVLNLRGSFRYIAVGFIVTMTGAVSVFCLYEPKLLQVLPVFLDLTGACMSFIIGERMYLRVKQS